MKTLKSYRCKVFVSGYLWVDVTHDEKNDDSIMTCAERYAQDDAPYIDLDTLDKLTFECIDFEELEVFNEDY